MVTRHANSAVRYAAEGVETPNLRIVPVSLR